MVKFTKVELGYNEKDESTTAFARYNTALPRTKFQISCNETLKKQVKSLNELLRIMYKTIASTDAILRILIIEERN